MYAPPCCPFELSPLMNLYRKACVLNNAYTLGHILMIIGMHIYQVKMVCRVQERLLPLLPLWVISFEWTLELKVYELNNSYTLCDILLMFGIHIYQVKTVCRVQEWLLPLLPLWVISFEWTLELKVYALNNSYTLWDILLIFGIHIYQVKTVCLVQEWLLPLLPLWIISFEWT